MFKITLYKSDMLVCNPKCLFKIGEYSLRSYSPYYKKYLKKKFVNFRFKSFGFEHKKFFNSDYLEYYELFLPTVNYAYINVQNKLNGLPVNTETYNFIMECLTNGENFCIFDIGKNFKSKQYINLFTKSLPMGSKSEKIRKVCKAKDLTKDMLKVWRTYSFNSNKVISNSNLHK